MSVDLRALTLTPEWAWAVCALDKRVENRKWAPPAAIVGQRIAIHAGSKRPDWGAVDLMARCARWRVSGVNFTKCGATVMQPQRDAFVRGAIVATAVVLGARAVSHETCVGWEVGPWCWGLDDVRVLSRPVPCPGALGLWRVPEELIGDVCDGR